ncbi:YhfZ family protein [Streptomyces sp. 8L]|uniref:YhfZ family protein n=1 Tax=Streptomyces sp. 8L TaxID=2877242 RepID=UPI001CD4E775|nr:YhfZ family protein [Streptomyces sp. 8L]MCA1218664.1 GntR family transcriptional regulator [Streptomyces sp. 8L]
MTATTSMTDRTGADPVEVIAKDALRVGAGGRLPTTTHYQEVLGVGSGTVQKALRHLRSEGALSLVARGHQGTFVTAVDTPLLWAAARLAPVHLLLPPSAPPESLGVAHAVARAFARLGALTTVGTLRGAEPRLGALGEGHADLTLMSAGAAEDLLPGPPAPGATGEPPRYRALTLETGTYYAPGSLVVVGRKGDPPTSARASRPRVGIDPRSDDHRRLTHAQFPPGSARYVETDFTHVPRAVLLGEIDTGVWHTVDSLIPLDAAGLAVSPLSRPESLALADAISPAVLVAATGNIPGILLARAAQQGALDSRGSESAPPQDSLRVRLDPGPDGPGPVADRQP